MPILVFVVVFLVAIPGLAWSELVTVNCDDPKGFKLTHGPNLPGEPPWNNLEQVAERFGSKPSFILDTEDPEHLLVLWGSYIAPELPPEAVEMFDLKAKAKKAMVVYRNDHQVTSIEKYQQGMYMYSLYPKLSYGVFSLHRNYTTGAAAPWMYYGPCTFHK